MSDDRRPIGAGRHAFCCVAGLAHDSTKWKIIVVVLLEVLDCEIDHVIDVGGVPRKQDPSGVGWRCIQTGALAREASDGTAHTDVFFSESE